MSVSLRFMLYLVPGIFAGSIFWWSTHKELFDKKSFRRFWKVCLSIAFAFAVVGNPHRSLSAVIPDSVQPWVHVSIIDSFERGLKSRKILKSISPNSSIAAETQLLPQLAQRRILLRFPENYQYLDEDNSIQSVDLILSQPRYNLKYAPAFRRERNWVRKSTNTLIKLVDNGDYGVVSCDKNSILLKKGIQNDKIAMKCFNRETISALSKISALE